METYENLYIKDEDEALWEIHEIRRKLRKYMKNKNPDQINNEAMKKFKRWKKTYKEKRVS